MANCHYRRRGPWDSGVRSSAGAGAIPSCSQCPRIEHSGDRVGPVHLPSTRGSARRQTLGWRSSRRTFWNPGELHVAVAQGRDRVNESILIVEDEPEFAALLERWITQTGYTPILARTGNEALRYFYEQHPDLVVLDVALPGLDGWQVIERIREFSRVPILMVTARSSEADKVRGLKLGADDYVTKPLSFPELMARIEAALRRAATPNPERPRRIQHRDLLIDLDDHRARYRGTEIRLTPTEFRLLAYLAEHAAQL